MSGVRVDDQPIGLIVDDDLARTRLTVFLRVLLAIPQAVWLVLWSASAIVVLVAGWFATLVTGSLPDGMHAFLARFLRASTHVYAYLLLLADPWPPFGGVEGDYPVDLRVDPPAPQSRLTVFFRIVLAVPALLLAYVFRVVNELIAFFAWFYCLAFGRMHDGLRDLSAWMVRYELQTYAYVFLLTGRYPSLAGGPRA